MQIIFVLVEPQVPENVGASARALKTMGFGQLRVVNSDAHQQPPAQWLAHGSSDVLAAVEHFASLSDALADMDLVVGTSAKLRASHRQLLAPRALLDTLVAGTAERIALVFGREDRGLSNEELDQCHLLTSIPLAVSYPSLNLAQAVMLYAYELSQLPATARHQKPAKNQAAQQQHLRARTADLFEQLGYPSDSKLHQWALERIAAARADDVRFSHSLLTALERLLRR